MTAMYTQIQKKSSEASASEETLQKKISRGEITHVDNHNKYIFANSTKLLHISDFL